VDDAAVGVGSVARQLLQAIPRAEQPGVLLGYGMSRRIGCDSSSRRVRRLSLRCSRFLVEDRLRVANDDRQDRNAEDESGGAHQVFSLL
jgi:hypothetical protein